MSIEMEIEFKLTEGPGSFFTDLLSGTIIHSALIEALRSKLHDSQLGYH